MPWFAQADIDSPWRRLHWTLPLALLICSVVFIWFAYSMERPAIRTQEPAPVNAEIVELPATAQLQPPSHAETIEHPIAKPAEQPAESPDQASQTQSPAASTAASQAASNAPALIANREAQATAQPLPVIPDELREDAMNERARARFHIAADGSVTVELVKPTQNPRLNRLLLDTLKGWKFNPAVKDGKPVESIQVMDVRVQVK